MIILSCLYSCKRQALDDFFGLEMGDNIFSIKNILENQKFELLFDESFCIDDIEKEEIIFAEGILLGYKGKITLEFYENKLIGGIINYFHIDNNTDYKTLIDILMEKYGNPENESENYLIWKFSNNCKITASFYEYARIVFMNDTLYDKKYNE